MRRRSGRQQAKHGKRRVAGDYQRGYQIAVKHGLVAATDIDGVVTLLRCTERWARDLTASERERERILRDEAILAGRAEGKSLRDVAREVGVDPVTVRNVEKRKPSENQHPPKPTPSRPPSHAEAIPVTEDVPAAEPEAFADEQVQADEPPTPSRADAIRANAAELESPRAQRWHRALAALRLVNEQAPVEDMFGDRYTRVDHAIGPELTQARDWINELHRRFFDE